MEKEQQIEKMARAIDEFCQKELGTEFNDDILANFAKHLYNADYRKQRDGEWETICHLRTDVFNAYSHICSKCKYFYKDFRPVGYTYCPRCGAKMKGGEE